MHPERNAMERRELRKILELWPHVMRQATDDFVIRFSQDIWKHTGDQNWRPTQRQAQVMRKLATELNHENDDCELIE